ncbi:MAG: MFS transporter [Acidimicrobiia bacterium]
MSLQTSIEPLRISKFRALWAASMVSNVGSFIQAVAGSWLMFELTSSPLWVGMMAASSTLPLLALALPAGAIADLFERRRVLIVAQSIMGGAAVAMAITSYLDALTPGVLLGLGLLLGVGLSINMPSWQALVPDLVPRGMIASAVALNSASFNVARAIGPALGGAIVAAAGAGIAFAFNAATYLGVIVVLARFGSQRFVRQDAEPIGSAMATGLRFARFTPAFRRLLAVAGAFAITSAVVQSMLPNVSGSALGGSALLYGLLLGAMGIGALVGAFSRVWAQSMLGSRMVPVSIALFGTSGFIVGMSRTPVLTGAAMAAAGLCWVWSLATLGATVQLLVPAWVRGRAMSLYTLSFSGLLPIGSIAAGVLGSMIGPAEAVAVLSLATVIVGLVSLWFGVPRLGEYVSTEPLDDWDPEPHDIQHDGGPVLIATTWTIDPEDLPDFIDAMNDLRLVRLTTGAYRWRLYRDASDVLTMTEVMVLSSWDNHLRQHRRIDQHAAVVIRRAASFDRTGGPRTRHMIAVDVRGTADHSEWDILVDEHTDLHRTDGSISLDPEDLTLRTEAAPSSPPA